MTYNLRFETIDDPPWDQLNSFPDRTLFQTKAWLDFVTDTQQARPVIAAIIKAGETVGYFTGLIVSRFGLKILGSPFPGWTTSYMGFNDVPGLHRRDALTALPRFAFRQLGCIHLELMDRRLRVADVESVGCDFRLFRGFEIDLTQPEEQLVANMTSACRRCLHKAEREGVVIQEAHDLGFADDYYDQLVDVFAKQSLAPTYPISRVRSLIKHLLPVRRLLLLRAIDKKGDCIATGIFPAFNDTMYFWGGASRRENQMLRPNESIQWYAMQYWRQRGIQRYDMGGGGDYKRKYGGYDIAVPWLRMSRYPGISFLRNQAQRLVAWRQHRGWFIS